MEFNKNNAAIELPSGKKRHALLESSLTLCEDHPGQQVLEAALEDSIPETDIRRGIDSLRLRARENITRSLFDYNVDVILGPADARMASVASAAGYPVGVVPLGFAEFNGRAFGINIIARNGEEHKILHAMSAWEATFPGARGPPPMLVNWER